MLNQHAAPEDKDADHVHFWHLLHSHGVNAASKFHFKGEYTLSKQVSHLDPNFKTLYGQWSHFKLFKKIM